MTTSSLQSQTTGQDGGNHPSASRTLWGTITGALGGVAGLAPHVLHHVGLLAGSGGTALFGVLGLVLSVPMLRRLHRRFRTWKAPAIGIAVFAGMFAVSAFAIGPQISGQSGSPTAPVVHHDGHLQEQP